jgi:hypothetical protein
MFIILCVIDQPERLAAVLRAWKDIQVSGVTILESTGIHRLIEQHHIPMRYSIGSTSPEQGNVTLFTVVENEDLIHHCLEATEAVIGDFAGPNTGIFIAWPLSFTKGVIEKRAY